MKQNDLESLLNNLPETPNVMAKENFANTAVLVPLICIDGEMHLLFQKRSESIRQGSEVCFPGGLFDPQTDKDYEDTAIRETIEELGIDRNHIKLLGRLDTLVSVLGVTVDPFLSVIQADALSSLKPNPSEVAKVFTLPVSVFCEDNLEIYSVRLMAQSSYIDKKGKEFLLLPSEELGLPEIYHNDWGGMHHRVLVYKTEQGVLWGITAEIIHDMVSKIKI
ncbi:MAG: CoA pyrophosphatase [Desulfobacterales bacterium]|nr:CoA pyrophosphatase [Desulfobacterales bacterium]